MEPPMFMHSQINSGPVVSLPCSASVEAVVFLSSLGFVSGQGGI